MRENEIEAKRLRETRFSHSLSGLIDVGFCLSKQLQISDKLCSCTSTLSLDNLVLRVVVLEFLYCLSDAVGQKGLGKDFSSSAIHSQFPTDNCDSTKAKSISTPSPL